MPVAIIRGTPLPAANPSAGAIADHSIAYVAQEKDQWCWAACLQMTLSFLGRAPMSQLQIATRVFGAAACANPDSASCNAAAFPNHAASSCQVNCEPRNRPLSMLELTQELGNGPVQAYFKFGPGSRFARHVALITSLRSDGTVTLLDPWHTYGISYPTVGELQAGYQGGTWEKTYVRYQ